MFVDRRRAEKHFHVVAKKVIITAPTKGTDIPTYVLELMKETTLARFPILLAMLHSSRSRLNIDLSKEFLMFPLVSMDFYCSNVSPTVDSSLSMGGVSQILRVMIY